MKNFKNTVKSIKGLQYMKRRLEEMGFSPKMNIDDGFPCLDTSIIDTDNKEWFFRIRIFSDEINLYYTNDSGASGDVELKHNKKNIKALILSIYTFCNFE